MDIEKKMSRRGFLKAAATTAAASAAGIVLAQCAPAPAPAPTSAPVPATAVPQPDVPVAKLGGDLNFLSWEGYDLPNAMKGWEKANNIKLNATYIGSNDEVMTKFKAGGVGIYDIGNVASRFIQTMIDQDMIIPLDLDRLPNVKDFYPQLAPGSPIVDLMSRNGNAYALTGFWGLNPIQYNTSAMSKPTTWDVLVDPKWKGKVGIYDNPTGTPFLIGGFRGHTCDARTWTKDTLADIEDFGKRWKANSKTLLESFGEMTDLMVRGDIVVAAEGYGLVTINAKKQGQPISHTVPPGKCKGYLDAWFIFKGSKNVDNAYAWLNQVLSPEAGAIGAQENACQVANMKYEKLLPKEFYDIMEMSDLKSVLEQASFARFPEKGNPLTLDDILKTWENIKAA